MRMRWCDLLFAHWEVDPAALRRMIRSSLTSSPASNTAPDLPAGFELDLFDGRAFVAAVPFTMEGVSPRHVPPVPGLHAFPELNLRTYVRSGGKPGVWFFSLDAGQRLAVRVARRFFHLPYFDASFEIASAGDAVDYSCVRTHRGAPAAAFSARYRPTGPASVTVRGSLDHWMTERYCLYAADAAGQLYRGDVDHQQWPLQPAEADIRLNTLGDWLGLDLSGRPAALHFSRSLDVRAWLLKSCSADANP